MTTRSFQRVSTAMEVSIGPNRPQGLSCRRWRWGKKIAADRDGMLQACNSHNSINPQKATLGSRT